MTTGLYVEAQSSIGKDYINKEDAREYSWVENGAYFIYNILSERQMVQIILASYEKDAEASKNWQRTVSADYLKRFIEIGHHNCTELWTIYEMKRFQWSHSNHG